VHFVNLQLWESSHELRHSVAAANQRHDVRRHLFVEIESDGTSGWGEVTPLASPVLGDPGVDDVQRELVTVALENVASIVRREGTVPQWSRVHLLAQRRVSSRWAFAAIEMALLDLELQQKNVTLDQYWSVDGSQVPTMATFSPLSMDRAWFPPVTCARVRVKTAPSVDMAAWSATLASWSRPVLLDFNGSADCSATVQRQLSDLANDVDVIAVEQPFAPGDLASHAALARDVPVALSLDEGVRSVLDVRQIARYEAAALVCVKPPRVGGVAVAYEVLSEAQRLGLRCYVGGFFETPVARRVHASLAARCPVEASDVGDVVDAARDDESPSRVSDPYGSEPENSGRSLLVTVTV
jgi:o-succinylbenzoate synthase